MLNKFISYLQRFFGIRKIFLSLKKVVKGSEKIF